MKFLATLWANSIIRTIIIIAVVIALLWLLGLTFSIDLGPDGFNFGANRE